MQIRLNPRIARLAVVGVTAIVLTGCHNYVKREEFDAVVAELRGNDSSMRNDLSAMKADLDARFKNYDAQISQMQGRITVDMAAHFDSGRAEVREQDKPALQQFAAIVNKHHPSAIITVEGFADAQGSVAYNKRLGQKRADAVRTYLVQSGMSAGNVRAVSYGKAANRQIVKGAIKDRGAPNRRVVLVVDYVDRAARSS